MKRIYLIVLCFAIFQAAFTQSRAVLPLHLKDKGVKAIYKRSADHVAPAEIVKERNPLQTKVYEVDEEIAGITWYDLQSNKLLGNRIHRYDDGAIGCVWTMGITGSPGFADRGTGYNYYDGGVWGPAPDSRLEDVRAGWPSYAPWGATGEMVASHDFGASEIIFLTREFRGTGSWTQSSFTYSSGPPELSWPRVMTSGENRDIVHLLANSVNEYEGMTSTVVYSRSIDGGITWEDENIIPDEMDGDYYTEIAADEYVWAEPNGGAIAFLVASAWHDLFMMKSDDDGETWEKTVIWEHPYPFFDWDVTITDTFFCVDNSASIALDGDGKAHVVFGINRVLHNEVGTSYFLFPFVDGIGYWNEDMDPFSNDLDALAPPQYGYANSEMVEDVNYIGYTQDYNGNGTIDLLDDVMYYREFGLSTMPVIAVSPQNTITVVFASTTEDFDNFDFNFKKIWMRNHYDGIGWTNFTHLTEDIIHIFDESFYPVIVPKTPEGEAHLLYNNDGTPGTALDEEHDYQENRMTYMKIQIPVGINEEPQVEETTVISQIYPNPGSDYFFLDLEMREAGEVEVTITDMLGREMQRQYLGYVGVGYQNLKVTYNFNEKGVYIINIKVNDREFTRRVIKS
jgi:hypothetical protein